jgi:hypothetical protein
LSWKLAVILVLAGLLDYLFVDPWFQTIASGDNTNLWDPLSALLFLHGLPFVVSFVIVGAVIGAITGGD